MGIGDWGFGVWGLGVGGRTTHTPTHNAHTNTPTPTKKNLNK